MGLLQSLFGSGQTADLKDIIGRETYLVDVREPGEFAGGTVKGAENIPLGAVASSLHKFNGKKNIVVFCRSGNRSAQAKTILEQHGFKNVVNGGTWENVNRFVS